MTSLAIYVSLKIDYLLLVLPARVRVVRVSVRVWVRVRVKEWAGCKREVSLEGGKSQSQSNQSTHIWNP